MNRKELKEHSAAKPQPNGVGLAVLSEPVLAHHGAVGTPRPTNPPLAAREEFGALQRKAQRAGSRSVPGFQILPGWLMAGSWWLIEAPVALSQSSVR